MGFRFGGLRAPSGSCRRVVGGGQPGPLLLWIEIRDAECRIMNLDPADAGTHNILRSYFGREEKISSTRLIRGKREEREKRNLSYTRAERGEPHSPNIWKLHVWINGSVVFENTRQD